MKSLNLGAWPHYSPACRRAVDRLLAKGGSLTAYRSSPGSPLGPREGSWAWKLERAAERMFGIRHVVACSSGTIALQAALRALDLPGADVVTTPYTFSATAAAIVDAGYTPVFADVRPDTFCLDPASVKEICSAQTAAVLPVDLFGHVPRHEFGGFRIVEDACQAVGGFRRLGDEQLPLYGGAQGAAGAWSMNGQKNVPAGEAGAVVTHDNDLARRMRRFVSHGENLGGLEVGLNGHLNELSACVAYFGLLNVHKMNAWRGRLALELWRRLKDEPRVHLLTPKEIDGHALYCYPLIVNDGVDRATFVRRLRRMGVEAREGYSTPLHRLPAFKDAVRIPLPVVEELEDRRLVLLLQVRPPARATHMAWLAAAVRAALGKRSPKAG